MKALGVDIDFAPVVDVSGATTGGVIGDRAYGADPTSVAAYAGAFAAGLRQAGILPTLKHFPGHGRAVGDSHEELATAPPLAELEQLDLVPYRELLDDGPSAVMVGHLDVAGLTEPGLPASLSPATYALLRDQLGFTGLVVTDELGGMAAVSSRFSAPEAVVRAIAAGADLALVTGAGQLGAVVDELVAALDRRPPPRRPGKRSPRTRPRHERLLTTPPGRSPAGVSRETARSDRTCAVPIGRRREADQGCGGLVGQLGRAQLVGPEQVGHDPQHPLHQRPALHPHPGELAHERRAADHVGEQAGDLEVLAVLGFEALLVLLQHERVVLADGLVEHLGGDAARSRRRSRCPRR